MCTCCQNRANFSWRSGCGCCSCNSCCGNSTSATSTNATSTNGVSTVSSGCGCNRYISFPVSGTAYVPTSAIYFCPNSLSVQNGTSVTGNGSAASNGCNSGCFGRCGGSAAIANYYEDYYARQYGLNN